MDNTKKVFKVGPTKDIAVSTVGKFVLERKISANKRQRFYLSNISSEVPFGKTAADRIYFFDPNGQKINSLFINKIKTYFNPDENQIDKMNLISLMEHPDVRVSSMSDKEHQDLVRAKLKKSNPKYMLINIDKVEDVKYETEKLIAIASNLIYTKGYTSKQLAHICAAFSIPYSIQESLEESKKNKLEQKIVNFIKQSRENAEAIKENIEKLSNNEIHWYYDLFIQYELVINESGFYKIVGSNKPIGLDKESVIRYLQENKEEYDKLKYEAQKFYKTA